MKSADDVDALKSNTCLPGAWMHFPYGILAHSVSVLCLSAVAAAGRGRADDSKGKKDPPFGNSVEPYRFDRVPCSQSKIECEEKCVACISRPMSPSRRSGLIVAPARLWRVSYGFSSVAACPSPASCCSYSGCLARPLERVGEEKIASKTFTI